MMIKCLTGIYSSCVGERYSTSNSTSLTVGAIYYCGGNNFKPCKTWKCSPWKNGSVLTLTGAEMEWKLIMMHKVYVSKTLKINQELPLKASLLVHIRLWKVKWHLKVRLVVQVQAGKVKWQLKSCPVLQVLGRPQHAHIAARKFAANHFACISRAI